MLLRFIVLVPVNTKSNTSYDLILEGYLIREIIDFYGLIRFYREKLLTYGLILAVKVYLADNILKSKYRFNFAISKYCDKLTIMNVLSHF